MGHFSTDTGGNETLFDLGHGTGRGYWSRSEVFNCEPWKLNLSFWNFFYLPFNFHKGQKDKKLWPTEFSHHHVSLIIWILFVGIIKWWFFKYPKLLNIFETQGDGCVPTEMGSGSRFVPIPGRSGTSASRRPVENGSRVPSRCVPVPRNISGRSTVLKILIGIAYY